MARQIIRIAFTAAVSGAVTCALAGHDLNVGIAKTQNRQPEFLGNIQSTYYDGDTDDLLTGGLGASGLAAPLAAELSETPAAAELRQRAIHTNYRAVLDPTPDGGYGRLYGPNIDVDGQPTLGEGKVPGWEYLAYANDRTGRQNVTLMVQVPDTFDPAKACIVTGTSSGSRGIYGAIGTSGEWGLKRGCAVAYTDKGTGNGLHDLETDAVGLIDGTRTDADTASADSHFTAPLDDGERQAFNAEYPNRVAYKHAHSQQNPEADWGLNTLQAIVFSFYILNENHADAPDHPRGGKRIVLDRRNTLVIASSISNGGGAALAAAEQDRYRLIDGVAVTEPNVQPRKLRNTRIQQGDQRIETVGKSLYDYFTYANLYQPCAAISPSLADAPALAFLAIPNAMGAPNRCTELAAKGLLEATTLAEQADEALAKLRDYGWLEDSDLLHASHYRFASNAIAVTYSNAYGQFSVADNVCGFSFANTDASGAVIAQDPVTQANIFATGNGVPPTSGVNIVYNDSQDGAILDLLGVSPSSGLADFSLDGALCHRNLAVGRDVLTNRPLSGSMIIASRRVRTGINQVQLSARLRKTPAIIVHGRADALVPVNHSSRAYYARNQARGRGRSQLRYIEVINAQHFDAFLPGGPVLGGYEKRFVPLHVYLNQALDWMYEHLTEGRPLPPSQVVRAIPRCDDPSCETAPPLTETNVPAIAENPPAGDLIEFRGRTLFVPD